MVNDCLDILLPSITKVVNCSFNEGVVLAGFKKSCFHSTNQKGLTATDNFKNNRPVSHLCSIFKFVKQVIAPLLNNYVSSNGFENVKQLAYKLGHLTKSALPSIKHEVHLALARSGTTSVVVLDQWAAFDMIDHGTLQDFLSSWFDGGVVLDWFKFYLSDHSQCVKIGSILSDAKKLLFVVPQGLVLGPILCHLYSTPLSNSFEVISSLVSTAIQMTHSYTFILHTMMPHMPLTG